MNGDAQYPVPTAFLEQEWQLEPVSMAIHEPDGPEPCKGQGCTLTAIAVFTLTDSDGDCDVLPCCVMHGIALGVGVVVASLGGPT